MPLIFAAVDRDRVYLRQWLPWVDATQSEEDTRAFVRSTLAAFAENRSLTAGIWYLDELAGVVGTHTFDWINRNVEIGYWLGERFQRVGLMTDAVRALAKHCLVELDLHRVEIRCAVNNERSRGVPRRLGFTHEATLREAELVQGVYCDLEVWSLLRSELKAL